MMNDVAFLIVLLFAATGLGLAAVRLLVGVTAPATGRESANRSHVLFAPLGLRRVRRRVGIVAHLHVGNGLRRESRAAEPPPLPAPPESPPQTQPTNPTPFVDQIVLAVPVGLGLLALGMLGLGEIGRLDTRYIAALLVVAMSVGAREWAKVGRSLRLHFNDSSSLETSSRLDFLIRSLFATIVFGTFLTALGPVTDGDALCYHLQVPKVFLAQKSVGFEPALHETVYPLVTEMLYAIGLSLQGPVACRLVQWSLGLAFSMTVTALARPILGRRAFWAGTVALAVPAVSNGMGAPLNDVALAAFGNAAILAWVRWRDRPTFGGAVLAGILAGLALGVKYPAIVLVGLLTMSMAGVVLAADRQHRPRAVRDLAAFLAAAILIGGCWYLRAYLWTGNPVFPFFRHVFGGAGIDEVLDPIKRPMAVNLWNVLTALWPMTLDPDRFDSLSHQFGPVFLMLLPGLLLLRAPRRIWVLTGLGYAFLTLCVTQRQSMRFVLIAVGPLSVAVAWVAVACWDRRTMAGRAVVVALLMMLAGESLLAVARARHALPVLIGRESAESYLARKEPTFIVGRWMGAHLPSSARVIGQDHRGFYLPRPYTMELAYRRRTGLASHGESPAQVIADLRTNGFTHVMMCPPVVKDAVEFDPTLSHALKPWLASREPVYRAELTDGDGVARRYAIYDLGSTEVIRR
jgi:hypothetical protein